MLLAELVTTCSNPWIAGAAVASIGAPFRARVARVARSHDLTIGEFAAHAVREFKAEATKADWQELAEVCANKDMPILCGLHHILETKLEAIEAAPERRIAGGRSCGLEASACCA